MPSCTSCDRGPGIDPDAARRRCSSPFATGDRTTGTGLGLAIVVRDRGRARRRLHAGAAASAEARSRASTCPARRCGRRSAHEPPRCSSSPPPRSAPAVSPSRCGRPTRRLPATPACAVLVARRTLPAGRAIDPAQVGVVRVPAAIVPKTALSETDQVAFRIAAVAIPPGLPIVASLLRRGRGHGHARRRRTRGRRAGRRRHRPACAARRRVGGRCRDRIRRDTRRHRRRRRAARTAADADGSWAVVLRLPARLAETVADAQAGGAGVRLLARGDAG